MGKKVWISDGFILGVYQANTLSKSIRQRVQDFHGWVEPFCQPIVASLVSLDLVMHEGENGAGRVTGLELDDEWMGKEVVLGTFFVGVQGIIEY